MKKLAVWILLTGILFGLTSCGGTPEPVADPVQPPAEPDPVAVSGTETETDVYQDLLKTEADALAFLNGSWRLCPMGRIPGEQEKATELVIDGESGKAELIRDDGEKITMDVSFRSLFGEGGHMDEMIFALNEISPAIEEAAPGYPLDYPVSYQFFVCNAEGSDLLMLREVGNGISILGDEGFGFNLMSSDRGWSLIRTPTAGKEEDPPQKKENAIFYAYRWLCGKLGCFLQEMDGNEFEEDWGFPVWVVSVRPASNGHALRGVWYPFDSGNGRDDETLMPGLVRVETDEDGAITDLEDVEYAGYGVYRMGTPVIDHNPIHIGWAEDHLDSYEDWVEVSVTDSDEHIETLVWPDQTVSEVKICTLFMDGFSEDNVPQWIAEPVYTLDELEPDCPLLLKLPYLQDMPTFGIAFTDSDGQEHLFEIWQSGKDGSLLLSQLLTNEFASLCLPGGNRRSSPTFGVRQPDPSAEASGLAAHRGVIDCTLPGEACSAGAVPFSGTRAFRRYSFPIR